MKSDASAEIAVVGNEGLVGTSLFLDGATTTNHGSMLIAGQGVCIGRKAIREESD